MLRTLFHSPCRDCSLHQICAIARTDGPDHRYTVALAGNPNTGKSTVFNALTGLRQHTGNWPGKTVTRAEGSFVHEGICYRLIDLPGTYSLLSAATEEEIARDFLLFGQPDCTVVVVDATALERNLNLVLQVMEITDKVVVCVNLMDEARRKGMAIDVARLSEELGVPAVGTAARKREGLGELVASIAGVIDGRIFDRATAAAAAGNGAERRGSAGVADSCSLAACAQPALDRLPAAGGRLPAATGAAVGRTGGALGGPILTACKVLWVEDGTDHEYASKTVSGRACAGGRRLARRDRR
jgi:GTP-binding protein EngB required for normal cell division